MRARTLRVLFGASLAVHAALFVGRAHADVSVSIGVFHDRLAPYGHWYEDARFGEVWAPRVHRGWRPYTVGHWVYTSDYGWLWVEAEPFGWAAYHYGRWFFDPTAGWIWIPGAVWAPAWVSWRASDDYCGWAPLAPRGYEIGAPDWVFVDQRHFLAPRLQSVVVLPSRNPAIFQRAVVVGSMSEERGRWRNPGVDVRRIEGVTGRRVEPLQVRDAPRARAPHVDPRRREVRVFRPAAEQQARSEESRRQAASAPMQRERAQRQAVARPEQPQRQGRQQPAGRQQASKQPPQPTRALESRRDRPQQEARRQELQRLKKEQPHPSERAVERREPQRAAVQPRPQPAREAAPSHSQQPPQRQPRQQHPPQPGRGAHQQPQARQQPQAQAAGHPPQPRHGQGQRGGKREGAKPSDQPAAAPQHP